MPQLGPVFSDSLLHAVAVTTNVTYGLTLAFGALLVCLIVTRSPASMRIYKLYLLAYTLLALVSETLLNCMKPVMLEPLPIFYAIGWFGGVSRDTFVVFFVAAFVAVYELVCCFSVLLVERLLAMTVVRDNRNTLRLYCAAISLVMQVCLGAAMGYGAGNGFLMPHDDTVLLLTEGADDGHVFVATGQALLGLDMDKLDSVLVALLVLTNGFAALLLTGSLTVTIVVAHRNAAKYSDRIRQVHQMLIRACIAQFVGVVVFVASPQAVFYLCSLSGREMPPTEVFVLIFMNTFMLYDMIVVIFIIRPYRNAVVSMLLRLHPGYQSSATGYNTTTILNQPSLF